MKEKQTL